MPMTLTFDMDSAAHALGWGRRSLQEFLKNTPADKAGTPYYYPNGNRKLFTERDIERIRAARREEERCRLNSSRNRRSLHRQTHSPAADDLYAEAQRLLSGRLPTKGKQGNVVSFRK